MSETLSGWLRQQRQSRSWAAAEMARQLRDAATAAGDVLPASDTLIAMIRRWERGAGVSERYRLYYCRVFGITVEQFGCDQPSQKCSAGTVATAVTPGQAVEGPVLHSAGPVARSDVPSEPFVAYGGSWDHDPGMSWITREVLMAAHESSEHAERAEHREIGDATLEQLRADVIRLSRDSMTGEPLLLFLEMRRVRNRLHAALDRRLWPRDAAELYLLLGCLSDLAAVAAAALGYTSAAEELIRAGWAYATVIDHRPLMAHLRLQLASICFWDEQPRQALDLAASGLSYLADGPTATHLHVKYARAAARLGDGDGARRAISAAADARERGPGDEILELGGEFGLSLATQHYFAGSALAELDDALDDAARELDEAASLYAAGPAPGEQHWFGGRALADIDRAAIRLRAGGLDDAVTVLEPVLSLPRGQRITALTSRVVRVRTELAQPIYRGSAQARELDERIEQFRRETIVADLHSLPGGSA